METIIAIVIGVLIVAIGVVFLVIRIGRKQQEALERIADSLSMKIIRKGWWSAPELVGRYRDREILMKNIYHSTGKSGYYTWRVVMQSLSPAANGSPVFMTNGGGNPRLFTRIGRAFTSSTITFDHDEFDSKVIVKAKDEMQARTFVDIEVQQEVLNFGKGTTTLLDGYLTFENYGMIQQNEQKIAETLGYLFKMEEKLLRIQPARAKTDPEYSGSYSDASFPEMTFLDENDGYYKGE